MWLLYFWIATQVIIEMLPISSSGHLALVEAWFKRAFSWDVKEYFTVQNLALSDVYYFLHIPTLCVMLFFFMRYCFALVMPPALFARLLVALVLANIITVSCYYLFKKYSISWPVICGLSITSLVLLFTYNCNPISDNVQWNYGVFIVLGLAQGIALLPGISRLAFTCSVGCCLGLSLFNSFILSWLIMVPLMMGAISKALFTLYQNGTLAQLLNWRICLAMLVSGVISWHVLSWVILLILTQKWWLLGWYMIIPIGLWTYFGYKKR